MAIAYVTSSNAIATGTSLTKSYTIAAGTDRGLYVGIEAQSGDTVTGVTFNGTAMTQSSKVATAFGFYTYIYTLAAPAVTTANIVISSSSSVTMVCLPGNYTGVDQTTPFQAGNSNITTSTNPSVTITTVTDNSWLIGFLRIGSFVPTVGANTVERNFSASDVGFRYYDSNGAKTPTGGYSLATNSASQVYGFVGGAIKPAIAATSHIKSADGILYANIKSMSGVAIANVKSTDSVTN